MASVYVFAIPLSACFNFNLIKSFLKKNTPTCIAYCIGETTAKKARKHFKDVYTAKIPTIESVIELVNQKHIVKDKKND